MAGQGLLNGRLLQSAAMDCTVHCSRLYDPLQRTIQSAAGGCSNSTDRQAKPKGRKRLVRLMKRLRKLKKRMQGLKTGGDNIRGQVFDRYAKSSRIMTGPLSPAEFSD